MNVTERQDGVVIRILGTATELFDEAAPPVWVAAYDPDDVFEWTADPARALVFPSTVAAWECFRAVSTEHPERADGKPNRPLTAFSIGVESRSRALKHGHVHLESAD